MATQNSGEQFNPNNMVSEIDLADGSKYTFTYHSYGDVAQMTLPTGGRLQYDYETSNSNASTALTCPPNPFKSSYEIHS